MICQSVGYTGITGSQMTPSDVRPMNRPITLNSIHKDHNNPSEKELFANDKEANTHKS